MCGDDIFRFLILSKCASRAISFQNDAGIIKLHSIASCRALNRELPMNCKAVQLVLGFMLTLLMFSFTSWGDFSWVTLTGPISLEADLGERETAGYVASPALQAIITRLLFLLSCFFFYKIPNLAWGLRQHARYFLGLAAVVYLHCSYFLGSFTFCASPSPETSKLRIAMLLVFFVLLVICYDTPRQTFKAPSRLLPSGFLISSAGLAIAVSVIVTFIFQSPLWLLEEDIHFVLLRITIFLTTLTGALAFCFWKNNN